MAAGQPGGGMFSGGFNLFGYKLSKDEDIAKEAVTTPSFTPAPNLDGAMEVAPGGVYGTFVDLEGAAKNDSELVTKYRELALQSEVEAAIEDIVNEAIIREDNKPAVEINLDDTELPDQIKERIRDEFKVVLKMLDFGNTSYDLFRRWYVDGRLYYHMMIDETKPRDGIKELRYIDPRRIRKVREPVKKSAALPNNPVVPAYNEYFIYMHQGIAGAAMQQGIKISKDSIAYVHSGVLDQRNKMVLSHLHKAIKPMNQLRMLEDAVVIYRLARAPERRIFYIDVGNLPKMKAEQYLKDMMTKHKNKLVYNAATGEVSDNRKHMTMLEDFWLPRREGGKGTEITTLQGGQNLGEMEDVEYFKRKLYKALNVPIGRLQAETTFNFGRASEISRDEVKFSRMIDRLRVRFSQLFMTILETQLILRGVMTRAEWKQLKESIYFDYMRDNYFAELKDQEVLTTRLSLLQNVDPYVGKYFSERWVREKLLRMTEDEIEDMEKEIEEEAEEAQEEAAANAPSDGQDASQQDGPPGAGPPGVKKPGQAPPPKAKLKPKPSFPLNETKERAAVLAAEQKNLIERFKTEMTNMPPEDNLELDEV